MVGFRLNEGLIEIAKVSEKELREVLGGIRKEENVSMADSLKLQHAIQKYTLIYSTMASLNKEDSDTKKSTVSKF